MNKYFDLDNKLKIYISFLIFYVIFYLYFKHDVSNDSSISEWLINYRGGFTRRGLGGELAIFLSNITNQTLRFSIFIIQVTLHVSYLFLVFLFFKKIKFNIIQIFALFTPIFLIYPVAELEVLGRKEIILFLFFLGTIFFGSIKSSPKLLNLFILLLFPIVCLIWEQIVLFAPYFLVIIILKNRLKTLKEILIKILVIFGPSILTFGVIFFSPLSNEGHSAMCEFLIKEFKETCYMSANLLVKNTIYFDTLYVVHGNANFIHYIRYALIIFVGFFPLHYLIKQNSFKKNNNFISNNFKLFQVYLILYTPPSLLFIFGYDWGRWINIIYTFSILLYFFFLKNNFVTNNLGTQKFKIISVLNKKKYLISIFIIFAFFWSPKTVITGDISTNTLYKIVYNSSKKVFGYERIRLFEDNPIIKFHKKYIE
jgi:hypothetical protein